MSSEYKYNFRFRLREPFAAGSHLLGALAGVFGAIYLLSYSSGGSLALTAIIIYSLTLITLFLISGIFHGLWCSENTINRLERCDYAAIYLFIAGTYTPVCLCVLNSGIGTWLLAGEWTLAFLGIWNSLKRGPLCRSLQIWIYMAMGWAFIFALPSLSKSLEPLAFNLLILGGGLYSIGVIFFSINACHLFRSRLSAHDLWHVLVLLGGAAHFAFVAQIIS